MAIIATADTGESKSAAIGAHACMTEPIQLNDLFEHVTELPGARSLPAIPLHFCIWYMTERVKGSARREVEPPDRMRITTTEFIPGGQVRHSGNDWKYAVKKMANQTFMMDYLCLLCRAWPQNPDV